MLNLITVENVDPSLINTLYREKKIGREEIVNHLEDHGGFFLLRNGSQSALVCALGDDLHLINSKELEFQGVKPLDAPQTCLLWAMNNLDLSVGLGLAGSGKTFLSVAYGLHQLFKKEKKLVLLKPTVFVGGNSNAIGTVPGDVREKLAPYIDSWLTHFYKILGKSAEHFMYEFEEEKKVEFSAVELCRGRHFEDSVVILDEAQNLSLHELLSVVSRVADSSQLILLGDPQQIDTKRRWKESGLYQVLNSETYYESEDVNGIRLETTYRGRLSELASEILYELNEDEEE